MSCSLSRTIAQWLTRSSLWPRGSASQILRLAIHKIKVHRASLCGSIQPYHLVAANISCCIRFAVDIPRFPIDYRFSWKCRPARHGQFVTG
jgi:hypothetical protein